MALNEVARQYSIIGEQDKAAEQAELSNRKWGELERERQNAMSSPEHQHVLTWRLQAQQA